MITYKIGLPGNEFELTPAGRESPKRSSVNIERTGRTAGGKFVKDIIAVKEKFSFSYQELSTETYNALNDLAKESQMASFYVDDIHYFMNVAELTGTLNADGIYESVTFTLEEV